MGRWALLLPHGDELARLLAAHAGRPDVVVLGLPRGGVPVAAEVARALWEGRAAAWVPQVGRRRMSTKLEHLLYGARAWLVTAVAIGAIVFLLALKSQLG